MRFFTVTIILASLILATNQELSARQAAVEDANQGSEYVQLVALADSAQIVANVKVRKAIKVRPERAPGLLPQHARLYIEAEVLNLIGGQGGIGRSIRYLVGVPLLPNGKTPKIKKQRFLIFANRTDGRPDEVQLIGPDAQLAWSVNRESQTRAILRELLAADSPPAITGVREVFHVPGNLEGEGETQIFLNTASGQPISISVIRRPGIRPSWAISLTEIVDAAAMRPARGTLLWYRLACGLPDTLPQNALYSNNSYADKIAKEDYDLVMRDIGACR